jgi:hypothetical protein
MTVPDYSHVIRDEAERFGPLTSHERCGQFTEHCAPILFRLDANFGHLKKDPGRTQYNGHAVDAVLYKATGQAVDIIGASKLASPERPGTPTWGVDIPRYSDADWMAPAALPSGDEEGGVNPPKPQKPPVPPPVVPVPVCQCAEVLEAVDAIYAKLNAQEADLARTLKRMEATIVAPRAIELKVPFGSARGTLKSPE